MSVLELGSAPCSVGSYPRTPCECSAFVVCPEVSEASHCSSIKIALQIAGVF